MKITREQLKKLANRLMYDMSDEEYELLEKEFEVYQKEIELIENIDTEGVDPMTFPFFYESIGLREDEPCDVLTTEEVLQNAQDVFDNQVKVKKVI